MTENKTRRRRRQDADSLITDQPLLARAGMYSPLNNDQIKLIHETALTILEDIGLADAPNEVIDLLSAYGGKQNAKGRLLIPAEIINKAMKQLPKAFSLHGRKLNEDKALNLGQGYAYLGSGGASPQILSFNEKKKLSTARQL